VWRQRGSLPVAFRGHWKTGLGEHNRNEKSFLLRCVLAAAPLSSTRISRKSIGRASVFGEKMVTPLLPDVRATDIEFNPMFPTKRKPWCATIWLTASLGIDHA
jgi:hypothetical protein